MISLALLCIDYSSMLCPSAEAVVVVRESAARAVSEVLDRFHSSGGVRMRFSVAEIPDQEDWGTADSLRAIKTRVKVGEIIACTIIHVGSLAEKYREVSFDTASTMAVASAPADPVLAGPVFTVSFGAAHVQIMNKE